MVVLVYRLAFIIQWTSNLPAVILIKILKTFLQVTLTADLPGEVEKYNIKVMLRTGSLGIQTHLMEYNALL